MKPLLSVLLLSAFGATFLAAQPPQGGRREPLPNMNAIAEALGVQCEYCHQQPAPAQGPRHIEVAKQMMAMTRDLNEKVQTAKGDLLNAEERPAWKDLALTNPSLGVCVVLGLSVGVPYLMLSTTGPLMQAWYAKAFSVQGAAAPPYRLYALSNLASMASFASARSWAVALNSRPSALIVSRTGVESRPSPTICMRRAASSSDSRATVSRFG